MNIRNALFASVIALVFGNSQAATLLSSTTINFSASGSPNTIAGYWSASPLDIATGDIVQYFSLAISDVNSAFGIPNSFTFESYFPGDSRSLEFGTLCPAGLSCVGQPTNGSISIVDGTSYASEFLFRLDPDNYRYLSHGQVYVTFPSGGAYATATGSVGVTAYGIAQSAPIPEPETYALVLAGLGFLAVFGLGRNRKLPQAS